MIWQEPKIPVNLLPSRGDTWQRFWAQLTSPISVGDVVVLQHPDRAGTVCKRVLGLPGDVVVKPTTRRGADKLEWKHDIMPMLNQHASSSSSSSTTSIPTKRKPSLPPLQANIASLKRGRSVSTLRGPDGHLCVEGDNPWNSNDSRNYGPIPAALIVGRVICRIWPIKGNAMIGRGDRPTHNKQQQQGGASRRQPSLAYSGSIVFPAGYRDQIIVRDYHQWQQVMVLLLQTRNNNTANGKTELPSRRQPTKQITTANNNNTDLVATAAEPKEPNDE
ncbi:MAG: hypothetical protein SGILL_005709 [Bacillariaceae sp.]